MPENWRPRHFNPFRSPIRKLAKQQYYHHDDEQKADAAAAIIVHVCEDRRGEESLHIFISIDGINLPSI